MLINHVDKILLKPNSNNIISSSKKIDVTEIKKLVINKEIDLNNPIIKINNFYFFT